MAAGKYKKWLEPENKTLMRGWAMSGLSDEQIAGNMGISRSTLNEWKKKYPDISDTLKKGKEVADYEVENALFIRACGIKETQKKAVKVRTVTYKDGKRVKETEDIKMVDEEIYIAPDTTAAIFWLKCRQPDKWNDKILQQLEDMQQTENGVIELPQVEFVQEDIPEELSGETGETVEQDTAGTTGTGRGAQT